MTHAKELSMESKNGQSTGARTQKFHERFGIKVAVGNARENFINRIFNKVFDKALLLLHSEAALDYPDLLFAVANVFGERVDQVLDLKAYIGGDFYRCLMAVEAVHKYLRHPEYKNAISSIVLGILEQSEVDLGIEWRDGLFVPRGAGYLDDKLVKEPLKWLSEPKYKTVHDPFEKGLRDFLKSQNDAEELPHVVGDMYEAMEALAKIVCHRHDKDLSGNRELFLMEVKASQEYKQLLKDYIEYANHFRHATAPGKPKPRLSSREVESFIYMTGLFIRLAME